MFGPCKAVGVKLKSPPAVILAPVGSPNKLNTRVWTGKSESVAVAVKFNVSNSTTDWLPILAKTGAVLTSFTVTVILSLSVKFPVPSSVTITSKV